MTMWDAKRHHYVQFCGIVNHQPELFPQFVACQAKNISTTVSRCCETNIVAPRPAGLLHQVDIMDVVVFSSRPCRFLPSGTSQSVQSNPLFRSILRVTPCRSIFCQNNGISSDANYHKARILLQGHKKNIQPIRRPAVFSGVRPS